MSDPARTFRSGLDERAIGATLGAAVRGVRALLPSTADYRGLRRSWRGDILAGLTVAIVALPLALAFGITTGLGAAAGLTTAIVAGLVAAVFGGSNVQVTGPTGAMAAVLVPIVHRHGPDAVILVGILASVMVIAAAFLRWGRYLAFVPWPVIEGFTIGIATIILLQQLPNVLGVAAPAGANTIEVAIATINHAVTEGRLAAVGIALLVVGVMVAVARFGRWLPGSLVAVVVATVATGPLGLDVATIGEMPRTLECLVARRQYGRGQRTVLGGARRRAVLRCGPAVLG